jgi:hypothetical protein
MKKVIKTNEKINENVQEEILNSEEFYKRIDFGVLRHFAKQMLRCGILSEEKYTEALEILKRKYGIVDEK